MFQNRFGLSNTAPTVIEKIVLLEYMIERNHLDVNSLTILSFFEKSVTKRSPTTKNFPENVITNMALKYFFTILNLLIFL